MFCNPSNPSVCAHLHVQHICHCRGKERARRNPSNKLRTFLQVQVPGSCDREIVRQLRKQEIDAQTNTENVIDGLLKHNAGLTRFLSKYAPKSGSTLDRVQQDPMQPADRYWDRYVSIAEERGLNYALQPSHPKKIDELTSQQQARSKPSYHDIEQQTSPRLIKQLHPHKSDRQGHGAQHAAHSSKLAKHYKDLGQTSRYLSDTAFRKHFHRQCFENYGRNNTTGVADGIVYGNYLKTFNINPHSGDNFPAEQETHRQALVAASPHKYQEYRGITNPISQHLQTDPANECQNHGKGVDGSCEQLQHQKLVRDPTDMDQVAKSAEEHQHQRNKYTNIKLVPRHQQEPAPKGETNQQNIIQNETRLPQYFQRNQVVTAHPNNELSKSPSPKNVGPNTLQSPPDEYPKSYLRPDARQRAAEERPPVVSFPPRARQQWQGNAIIPPVVTLSECDGPNYCLHASNLQSPEFQDQFHHYVMEEGFKKSELAQGISQYKNHVPCNICSQRKYTKCCCT